MESTGVYWKPIVNLLEATGMEVLVVNAAHIKAVPGRKTDIKDAEWIADLLRHGLLRGSFIPDREQRELRELVQYRRSLIQEQTRTINRIQKVLEGANIKLKSVISDVVGVSGRAILEALIAGASEPNEVLKEVRKTRLKASPEDLEQAVHGVVGPHQRQMLAWLLGQLDFVKQRLDELDAEIEERMRPFDDAIARLDTIPGVGTRGAQEIIAAIGTDMNRFPTSRHLASWAKVSPGNNESAGKRKSGKTGTHGPWFRVTLVEAAHGASKKRDCYLATQFWRLVPRKGKKRAAVAVAHSILEIAYHILKHGTVYEDLGSNYFDQRSKEATKRRAIQRLERLGFKVQIEEAA